MLENNLVNSSLLWLWLLCSLLSETLAGCVRACVGSSTRMVCEVDLYDNVISLFSPPSSLPQTLTSSGLSNNVTLHKFLKCVCLCGTSLPSTACGALVHHINVILNHISVGVLKILRA